MPSSANCGASRSWMSCAAPPSSARLLLAWISLRPFADLGNLELKDVSTGNEALTYLRSAVWRC